MKLSETAFSDIGRKMSGRVSGKEHVRRTALQTLQRVVDGIKYSELLNMFGADPDAEIYGYLDKLRQEAIDAIDTIKSVEK